MYTYFSWASPGFREVNQMQIIQTVKLMEEKNIFPLLILVSLASTLKIRLVID